MSAPSSTTISSATLLVVDDEAGVRRRLRQIFEGAGHRALLAADAPKALSLLHREHCDLIVLDIEMPGVDGLALCRLLRAQAATKQLPIVIFSARDDENRKVEAFAAGADDYIVKPSTPREILTRVSAHLETAQREWALVGSNLELRFLADLGRGLLRALEPEQVVRHVAGATYEGTGASLCAAAVSTGPESTVICAFDREGSAEDASLVHTDRLKAWLASPGSSTSTLLESPESLFLRDEHHRIEYAAPLRFGGRTKGVIVVGFDSPNDWGEKQARLVDAAAQQAALAAHVATLYQAARQSSVHLAKEVERRTAEAEAQRRFTEAIIDSLPLSLYAVDRDYRIVAWNRNRELGGQGIPRRSALGRSIFDVLTKQKRDVLEREFRRAFETGEIERIEQETTGTDGETHHWLISKIPMRAGGDAETTHVITVGEDISARVEANRAVARAEKLAAVGRLAAGVVHEINNPLATISACAEALEARLREGAFDSSPEVEDLREYLSLIRNEAFRCKSITNGLLDFSRTRAGEHLPVNIGEVINSAARLVAHQRRGERIEIQIEVADDVSDVSGDEGQLQQAVIALATNAIDAMPEGGRLTLRGRDENDHVLLEVSDTGVGIAPENLTKIFDPFFTTKEIGRGTGLGLAVCYGIVTEHGGRLDVQSVVGAGTTFTISLPAANPNMDGD
ncbi:MAG TPA: response regulator [Pyrinomonadaceae bacterium]|nr:response regulator [Pyrinomonadaceae bacterium]